MPADTDDAGLPPPVPPPPSPPPEPATGSSICFINADCPAGEHCDLGECTQDCNSEDLCDDGQTCSVRARCLEDGVPDEEPLPDATYQGVLTADPLQKPLTDSDTSFEVKLTSSSPDPVDYRVEITGPYLRLDSLRGTFTAATTLTVHVEAQAANSGDSTGSLKFFTSIGEVVINAPLHRGIGGSYQGGLRYTSGDLTLGDTPVVLQLTEHKGTVKARFDPTRSMLFPAAMGADASHETRATEGTGTVDANGKVELTLRQRIDASFGGTRNPLRRDVGRELHLSLTRTIAGGMDGTFTESIVGLFPSPVTTSGQVALSYVPNAVFDTFDGRPLPAMPPAPTRGIYLTPKVFDGWVAEDCGQVSCGSSNACPIDQAAALSRAEWLEQQYAKSLMASPSKTFQKLADACDNALQIASIDNYDSASDCSLVPPLACALPFLIELSAGQAIDDEVGKKVVGLIHEVVTPGLLIAKNEMVGALADAVLSGISIDQERGHYSKALAATAYVTQWIFQPSVLDALARVSAAAAKGDGAISYPAARALADLVATESLADAELARLPSPTSPVPVADPILAIQTRAVVTYLEVVAIAEIVRSWGLDPVVLGGDASSLLADVARSFAERAAGANIFGVPEGFVPFVYRPEQALTPTNFEQMLAIAEFVIQDEAQAEEAFKGAKRAYDYNRQELKLRLNDLGQNIDLRLRQVCGADFNPNAVFDETDWDRCGRTGGELAVKRVQVEQGQARRASALHRISNMKQIIRLDTEKLAATQNVQAETLSFVKETGDKIVAIVLAEGMIQAVQDTLSMAAQSDVWNGGAPAAAAGATLGLGIAKAGLQAARQDLELAQQLRTIQASKEVEYINGMAEIQRGILDLAQLNVEIHQDILALEEAKIAAANELSLAKALLVERERALSVYATDPANDPTYRLVRDSDALDLVARRDAARKQAYLVANALQYEVNMSIAGLSEGVMVANNASRLKALQDCMTGIHSSYRIAYGSPQEYTATVSVRRMLGIVGPRTDEVTGQTLTPGEQFRKVVLQNQNLDGSGGVGIAFATDLQPGNLLWSSDVCNDRITTIEAQLVGDYLGDNNAVVELKLAGGNVMRACNQGALMTWSVGGADPAADLALAVVQAGVNTYGDAPPNASLFGQAVARASWNLVIPGRSVAPVNVDVDLTHLDDILLRIVHRALPLRSSPLAVDTSCLARIGR